MKSDTVVLNPVPDQFPLTQSRTPVVGDRVVVKGLIGIFHVSRVGPDNICDLVAELTKEQRLGVPNVRLTYLFKP